MKIYNQPEKNLWLSDEELVSQFPAGTTVTKFIIPIDGKSRKQAEETLAEMISEYKADRSFDGSDILNKLENLPVIDREFPGWRSMTPAHGMEVIIGSLLTRIGELERKLKYKS